MGPAGKRWSSDAEIHWARSENDALEVHRSVGLGDEFVRASEKPYSAQDERTTVTLRPGGPYLRRVDRGGAPWSGAFVEYANGACWLVRYEAGKAVERMAAEEPTDLQNAVAALRDREGATWIQQLLAELEARRTRLRAALAPRSLATAWSSRSGVSDIDAAVLLAIADKSPKDVEHFAILARDLGLHWRGRTA